jgi:hypothetical protein
MRKGVASATPVDIPNVEAFLEDPALDHGMTARWGEGDTERLGCSPYPSDKPTHALGTHPEVRQGNNPKAVR